MKLAATLSLTIACLAGLAASASGRAAVGVATPAPGGAPDVAVRVTLDFPTGIAGKLRVAIRDAGRRKAVFEAESDVTPEAGRPPMALPPMPPGRYDVSIRRLDDSWECGVAIRFPEPVATRLFVAWREPAVVQGRVVSPAGEPVPEVPISISTDPPTDGSAPTPRGQLERWRCSGPASTPRTGPDGGFRVVTDPRDVALIVAGGWGDARGIAFRSRTGPSVGSLRLVLARPHRVAATVLDDDDHPVPCRARVILDDGDERWAAHAIPGGLKDAICAPDGKIDAGPFVARTFELSVSSDEALPTRVPGRAGDLGVIRLDRGAALRVSLRDPDRAPVEGATVTAVSRTGFVVERTARSAADGVAWLKGLVRGARADVTVEAPGFSRWTRRGVDPEGDLAVSLVAAALVRGVVKNVEGEPVRAVVEASTSGGEVVGQASCDAGGAFAFSSLPGGVVRLQASARGYRPSQVVGVRVEGDDPPDPVELTLAPISRLQGTVRDPSGAPLAGATVVLVSGGVLFDPPELNALAVGRTASDGAFTLEATGATDETLVAVAPGYGTVSRRVTTLSDRSSVDLALPAEARLIARVPSSLPRDAVLFVADESLATRLIDIRARTEILVEGLVSGSGIATLGSGQSKPLRLVAGETATVDLSSGARIRGRVFRHGRPSPNTAVVLAAAADDAVATGEGAVTAADGTFVIASAAPGAWNVVASSAAGRAEKRIVVPSEGEIEVELELSDRSLRVAAVEQATATPITGATVVAGPRGIACSGFGESEARRDGIGWHVAVARDGCVRSTTGADGVASFALAGSGAHAVSVTARGFASWGGVVDVVEGTIDLRAELSRGGPPTVRVAIDSEAPGISGTLYCVQGGRGASQAPVVGEGVCEGLQPGPAEVAFRAASFGLARATIEAPQSGETMVSLHVMRGGVLIAPLDEGTAGIRVIDAQGTLWNRPYGLGWPRCGLEDLPGSGRAYVCHELPPGTYAVEIDGTRRAPVLVRGGETVMAR